MGKRKQKEEVSNFFDTDNVIGYAFTKPLFLELSDVNDLGIPHHKGVGANKDKRRILMVFDETLEEEREQGNVLGGHPGELLTTCLLYARKFYPQLPSIQDFDWACINLDYLRLRESVGKEKLKKPREIRKYREQCLDYNSSRVLKFIKRYKPTHVWCFGTNAYKVFSEYVPEPYASCTFGNLLGTPVPITLDVKDAELDIRVFPVLPVRHMFLFGNDTKNQDKDPNAYLIGYLISNIANALNDDRIWEVNLPDDGIKCTYIDTITKFRKMLAFLREKRYIAVDTETDGLAKVQSKMLTIQFAVSSRQGFFLPVYHYDSPFSTEEIVEIEQGLVELFSEYPNKVFIFHNTVFDLNIIRSNLGIRHMPFDTWDIQDGEYANDENLKAIPRLSGNGYFNLANLSIQYGFYGYVEGEFGKSDRTTISEVPLNTPGLIEYGCYDVCVPFSIRRLQIKRADHFGHEQYRTLVGKQLSDTQHMFSVMNQNGCLVDSDYLWWLDSAESPFLAELQETENSILSLPEVKEAEEIIREDMGAPAKSLFGVVDENIFDLTKTKHVQTLFFDVFKFDKVSIGADGSPNIDKKFQAKYKEEPIVKAYVHRNQVRVLRNTYVKGILKKLSEDKDARVDSHLRTSFDFRNVVTFRSSSNNPNLQNIPEHSALAKHIKRVFIVPSGYLLFKVDYSAHEVRCLCNCANDKELAQAFQVGLDLRTEYLANPTEDRKLKMNTVGDVHFVNANMFFDLGMERITDIKEVNALKPKRNEVKSVIFGSVYGRSTPSIAEQIGQTTEYTQNLLDRFYDKYASTGSWLNKAEETAVENIFVENPMGARRHLWPYLLPKSWRGAFSLYNACGRRARNSPIQGYASQINYVAMRLLEKTIHKNTKHLEENPIRIVNTVHDSVFAVVRYDHVFKAITMFRHCMMQGTELLLKRRHAGNAHFPIAIEIDMDIGSAWSETYAFDGNLTEFYANMAKTLEWQKSELNYDIDVLGAMDAIFGKNGERVTKDFKAQISNKYFDPRKSRNALIRSLDDRQCA